MYYKNFLYGKVNSAYHQEKFTKEFTRAELSYLSELILKDIKDNGMDNDIEYHGPDEMNVSGIKSLKHYLFNVIEG